MTPRRRSAISICLIGAIVAVGCGGSETSSDATTTAEVTIDSESSTQANETTEVIVDTSEVPVDTAQPDPQTTAPPLVPSSDLDVPTLTPDEIANGVPTTVPDGPLAVPAVQLVEVASFDNPVELTTRPGDTRNFVVEQGGRVVAFDDLSTDVVADISNLTEAAGERGLLGAAFHPGADLAYLHYSNSQGDTVVAEYEIDPVTAQFDLDSAREVLTVDQPFGNHNGGEIAFGPDQLLYIGLGDGGSADDPERNGLSLETRLGKILRIDPQPSASSPFVVPTDNPFATDSAADPTIWAYGLRNPWKFSFDDATGDLWIADVGQNQIEEINMARHVNEVGAGRGLSFGWSAFEGTDRFNGDQTSDNHTPPVYEYTHGNGDCSVSGGAVARDSSVSNLNGWYVFGDYCSGTIWGLDPTTLGNEPIVAVLGQVSALTAIAVGGEGELFALSASGSVSRLSPG